MEHPHALYIKQIGRVKIMAHFECHKRTVQFWQSHGIPKIHHRSFVALAADHGVTVTDLKND